MRLIEAIVLNLLKENRKLKSENSRLREDKEENEAMYERVIARYKAEIDAIQAAEKLRKVETETYNDIINKLK